MDKDRRQRGFVPVALVVILLLLIAGGAGTYFYTRQNNAGANLPKVSLTTQPSPQNNPIINLKTYTDSVYRYSFQYPDSWLVEESTQQFQMWDRVVNILSSTDASKRPDVAGNLYIWKPSVAGRKMDLQTFLEKPPTGGFKQTTVGGYKAYRADEIKDGETITLLFEKDSQVFQFSFTISGGAKQSANSAIVEGIIQSLKFN